MRTSVLLILLSVIVLGCTQGCEEEEEDDSNLAEPIVPPTVQVANPEIIVRGFDPIDISTQPPRPSDCGKTFMEGNPGDPRRTCSEQGFSKCESNSICPGGKWKDSKNSCTCCDLPSEWKQAGKCPDRPITPCLSIPLSAGNGIAQIKRIGPQKFEVFIDTQTSSISSDKCIPGRPGDILRQVASTDIAPSGANQYQFSFPKGTTNNYQFTVTLESENDIVVDSIRKIG